ncbi:hypothetical protein HN51_024545 [Arachis hypogaea]
MAAAEATQAAAGPRLLYYWNPETNVTQYEKPPPLPWGPALAASTPNMAPIPVAHAMQSGGMMGQHGQQMLQSSQQQGKRLGGSSSTPTATAVSVTYLVYEREVVLVHGGESDEPDVGDKRRMSRD